MAVTSAARRRARCASSDPERTRAGHGIVIDVRVEDDPEPIPELRRLTEMGEAYGELEASEEALDAGDLARALELAAAAAPKLPAHRRRGCLPRDAPAHG